MWLTLVYATSRLRSVWPKASSAPYRMPITASVMMYGESAAAAPGKSGTAKRSSPYAPTFSTSPARITLPAVGASVCASGSHVCTGTAGSFTANAAKNARNSQSAGRGRHRRAQQLAVIERVDAGGAAVNEVQAEDADEHQQPAGLREEEELDGRVDAALVPPEDDEEVQRHEHHFPEEVEEEQVHRQEDAGDRRRDPHQVEMEEADALLDSAPRGRRRRGCPGRPSAAPAAGSGRPWPGEGNAPVGNPWNVELRQPAAAARRRSRRPSSASAKLAAGASSEIHRQAVALRRASSHASTPAANGIRMHQTRIIANTAIRIVTIAPRTMPTAYQRSTPVCVRLSARWRRTFASATPVKTESAKSRRLISAARTNGRTNSRSYSAVEAPAGEPEPLQRAARRRSSPAAPTSRASRARTRKPGRRPAAEAGRRGIGAAASIRRGVAVGRSAKTLRRKSEKIGAPPR